MVAYVRGMTGGRVQGHGQLLAAVAGASERFLLLVVLAAAAAGVAAPAPGRAVSAGGGNNAALAVLVLATALSLRVADLAAASAAWLTGTPASRAADLVRRRFVTGLPRPAGRHRRPDADGSARAAGRQATIEAR